MARILKWVGLTLGGLVGLGLLVAMVTWWHSEQALAKRYSINDAPLQPSAEPAVLARGAHLYLSRGCAECHGEQGEGGLVMDAGPVLKAVASNLTTARLDPAYDIDAIAAAVRHGVRADGRSLVFMPAANWSELGDEDMAALASYILALPPTANDPGQTEVRPLGRLLNMLGAFPLLPAAQIDHRVRVRETPIPEVSVAYGQYVANYCVDCHGADLRGGMSFGPHAPPSANLTPHADGLEAWTEDDFVTAMRRGLKPDGSELDPMMPWRATANLSDTELAALWHYVRSVPALPNES